MKAFADLSSLVQVGTRNGAVTPSGYLDGLESRSTEASALAEAGLLGLMNRAGTNSRQADQIVPSPEETNRIAEQAAAPLLEALDGKQQELVLEWAREAARREVVAPHVVLNRLLELSSKHSEVVLPILGARGRWLAALQEIDLRAAEKTWMERFREDSDDFREKLAKDFEGLDWQDRVKALEALKQAPTGDDVALLEKGLGDRRQEIRHLSAEILASMPSLPFTKDLTSLALSFLKLEKSLLRRKLAVDPPEPDRVPKAIQGGSRMAINLGPRAQALYDVVRFVPPQVWSDTLNLRPDQLFEMAAQTEYADALIASWLDAALRFRDQVWIDLFFDLSGESDLPYLTGNRSQLAHAASESAFELGVGKRLKGKSQTDQHSLYSWLVVSKRPLSPQLSTSIVNTMRGGSLHPFTFMTLGASLHISAMPLLRQSWNDNPDTEKLRESWLATVSLRSRLLDSLES